MKVVAIYSDGVLKPVEPLEGIAEGTRVIVTIERIEAAPLRSKPLDGWVSLMSDEEADEMRRVIEAEFEKIDPEDWK